MVAVGLSISEKDLIKLVLEFLESRGLHIAQLALERETGVINGLYSEDGLFLRQLILDGQWDSAMDFADPLRNIPDFNFSQFNYLITKYKYFELLCIKAEPGPLHNNDFTVDELVECLKHLEKLCTSQEDFRQLCALLALPRLSDHVDFKNWNPSSARIECFHKVYQLVKQFLPSEKIMSKSDQSSQFGIPLNAAVNERFLQLVSKGLFYESCVDFCQSKAVGDAAHQQTEVKVPQVLEARGKLAQADASLVSWLESLSLDQFSLPFEQKTLDMKLEALTKPALEAQWTEQILQTPIRPLMFPHAMVPHGRLKSAEKMSRSMIPMPMTAPGALMTASMIGPNARRATASAMSQSVAPGFIIRPSTQPQMQTSQIDLLFETSDLTRSTMGVQTPFDTQQQQVVTCPPTAPMAPTTSLPPMVELSAREQLEEIKRRSQTQTPPRLSQQSSVDSSSGFGGGGKLFQEFNNRFQQRMSASHYRAASEPPSNVHYAPTTNGVLDAVSYQMLQMSMCQAPSPQTTPRRTPQPIQEEPCHSPSPAADYAPRGRQYSAPMPQANGGLKNVQFVPVCRLEDPQAIRAACFHPSGRYIAVGTNSKQLHVCKYPDIKRIRDERVTRSPEVLLTRPKQHRGSVYCAAYNPTGELLATGSNDKTVRLMSFNADNCKIGAEMELTMHDGTVRDLVFMEDTSNRTSLLISGGAGNCAIHATDCATGQGLRALHGHTAPILGLHTWGGCMFVSCSQDKTIRFWDLRCTQAVNLIAPGNKTLSSPVTSICVDPGGRLLVSGHEDASVMLYDIGGSRVIQLFRPHGDEVRAVRFSPGTYYLLSGSYDKKVVITDMRGDLMAPLLYLPVAEHHDKIIQCRWHPHDFTFLSTSADRSAVLWALPPPS